MPVLDETGLEINHENVESVDSNTLIADNDAISLGSIFLSLLKHMHITVSNIQLVAPLDEVNWFCVRIIDIQLHQKVPQLAFFLV